jgi:hypothetical protein
MVLQLPDTATSAALTVPGSAATGTYTPTEQCEYTPTDSSLAAQGYGALFGFASQPDGVTVN